jgi:DeoR/GlpR family transcriptional regulator of sugar metabolism
MKGRQHRAGPEERRERILRDLKLHAAIRVSHLAKSLGVTTETIRRDLDALGESGIINRTYGGAALPPGQREPAVHERERTQVEERSRIGAHTASLIPAGSVLMIDAGSTTLHFARHLASHAQRLTAITNCVGVATTLGVNGSIRVVLCPGDYMGQEGGVFGTHTADFIRRFNADVAVIGASGIDAQGVTEALSEAVGVKQAMLDMARRRILLVDSGKFEKSHLERVGPLDTLTDIVTERAPRGPLAQAIREAGAKLHVAGRLKHRA